MKLDSVIERELELHSMIEESEKIDISTDTELVKFDEHLDANGVSEESERYKKALIKKFHKGTDDAKRAYNKIVQGKNVTDSFYLKTPMANGEEIRVNYLGDEINPRGPCVTWFHEHGHR